MMAAPKSNTYYRIAKTSGRPLEYNPDQLRMKFNEYSTWVLDNPLIETDYKSGKLIELPKMRPFTIEGFCTYAGIVVNTFKNYAAKSEFIEVTSRIRQVIEMQQFEGAAAGLLNPNIIARKLGLKERMDTTTNDLNFPPPIIQIAPNDWEFPSKEDQIQM